MTEPEIEAAQRALVCRLAREWVRTPYRHQGRIKGVAADCTFFAEVYAEAGLMPAIEIPPYSPQAHLNRGGQVYMNLVTRYAREVETPQPGDIVLYKIGRAFAHGAVVINPGWPNIVHADIGAGFVILALGDQAQLASVERKFFSHWR